jgi:hypothetical protein
MGVNTEEYRARTGSFSGVKWTKQAKGGEWKEEYNMKLWFCGLVIVLGGVEINPGPFSVKEEAEIF